MSGLSSTRPDYYFMHGLSVDGFDHWLLNGISNNTNDERECLLPVYLAFKEIQTPVWAVLELQEVQLNITFPSNLDFYGVLMQQIGGELTQLRCAGSIAMKGMGVLWTREADELL